MIKFFRNRKKTKSADVEQGDDFFEQELQGGHDYDYVPHDDELLDDDNDVELLDEKVGGKWRGITLGDISNTKLIAIIVVAFILFHIFYSNSYFRICVRTQMEINDANAELDKLNYQLKQDCVIIYGIKNDEIFLIKYARENLYLSDTEEDIYLIDDK